MFLGALETGLIYFLHIIYGVKICVCSIFRFAPTLFVFFDRNGYAVMFPRKEQERLWTQHLRIIAANKPHVHFIHSDKVACKYSTESLFALKVTSLHCCLTPRR